jgi:hypothetical protein
MSSCGHPININQANTSMSHLENTSPSSPPERPANAQGNFYSKPSEKIAPGMNERIQKLRKLSVETPATLYI